MKTIGKFLKEERLARRHSLSDLETETKIKKSFISAIEKGDWNALPEYPVVTGFVKNIAKYLNLNERSAVALLRRDYPPKVLPINPKPDVMSKFSWSPRLTFLVGVGIVMVLIIGYLVFQYSKFVSPPSLLVSEPKESQTVKTLSVKVSGRTDPDASLTVNNQPVLVNDDGSFNVQIQIFQGTGEIVVKALSRSGKETIVRRKIIPEIK